LQELQAFKDVLSGVLIIVVTLALPGGVVGELMRRRARRKAPLPAAPATTPTAGSKP
jgi:hypothetical protein